MPKHWTEKYTAYEKNGSHHFYGDYTETVLVEKGDNSVVAHFKGYADPSVQEERNPTRDGLVGNDWGKDRPKGYRKCRNQEDVLDWAVEAMWDWRG